MIPNSWLGRGKNSSYFPLVGGIQFPGVRGSAGLLRTVRRLEHAGHWEGMHLCLQGQRVGCITSLLALRRRRESEEEGQHKQNSLLSVEATLPEWRGGLSRCLWVP